LHHLQRGRIGSFEQVRASVEIRPQEFQRIVRRLQTFDLVWTRAPRGSNWEGYRIRVAFEIAPKGKALLQTLEALDRVLEAIRAKLGASSVDPLIASAE
jgi:hypothetical protein